MSQTSKQIVACYYCLSTPNIICFHKSSPPPQSSSPTYGIAYRYPTVTLRF